MILKALEMQGFKSFPDKTVFKFGKGITTVVGPNGSGKSNISDAVRWVLGEQSSKSLRGSRMEDVIFSGTSVRKAQGYAEVTLRLDNSDRTLDCDSDEVAVTRRYYRSGESEYLLNGEGCRLKDINEMFMDTGLGRDGYSIVSQGRVADMVSSKSSQRREMLEEAAGISHFRYRRTDANRKLAQAEENLVRLRDILAELESRVGPLKNQSEKAHKFLTLAGDKKELEVGLWLHTIEKSKQGLKSQEQKLSVASTQYDTVERELEGLEYEIESVFSQGQNITVQIDNIRQNASLLEEEAARVDGQIAVEKNTIEHNKESIGRVKRDIEQASGTEQHIGDQIDSAMAEIDGLNEKIKLKYNELAQAAENISGAKQENAAYAEKANEASQTLVQITSELSEKKVDNSSAISTIEELKQRILNIDDVLRSRDEVLEELTKKREIALNNFENAKESVSELGNSMSGYKMRVQKRSEKEDLAKKDLEALNLDIHQKSARIRMLEDLEKNMEGYSGSVRAVMREVKGGMLRGIHGPLSQLINVGDKYAVAIETALGAAVQFIVTDNENDAKRGINFLKEKRAGRATFLPITAIKSRPFNHRGLDECFGFVAMANELLEYDSKYDEIIKYQLSHTAVVEDMDCAIVIAKKYSYRFRIVTLNGQVINAGGSMTGGSRGQGSGILSRTNEIEKLKKAVGKLKKDYELKSDEYKIFSQSLSSAQADLDGAGADLARAQEELIRSESDLKLFEDRLETAMSAISELKEEKERSTQRIEDLEKISVSIDAEILQLNEKVEAFNDKIIQLGKSRESLEVKREELAELENKISLDIVAIQKDIEAKQEAIASLKRRRCSHEGRVDELNEEIAQIEKANEEINVLIEQLSQKSADLRNKNVTSKSAVEELVKKRSETETKSSELRAKERTMTADKEKLGGELARLEERKLSMENELEGARNKLYDEYQLTLREAEDLNIVVDDPSASQRKLNEIKSKIRALGSVNVGAIEEYKEVSERYEFMSTQIDDVEKSREELDHLINDLTGKMAERFREQFARINSHFGETFAELFNGGKAELYLENPLDVLESSIEIKVQPPGKNVKNIDLLSGGEKGLSAIALLFAILKVTPAPFCVFDEVEAALDDINVTRYAKYVRRMTKNTQFILITHRRGTMEESDILYGVTMQEEGVSKTLELRTAEMASKLGI
ncbi:MAG TPA: chromosome segregation protein SMC [Clostridia bacterium]|nr:chromosome segregation protein SMC [Clostridia bacterium]